MQELPRRQVQCYGWVRDIPDARDFVYTPPQDVLDALPKQTDLTAGFPSPPYDQGDIGSCTANDAAARFEYALRAQGLPVFMPSRLFIYYGERVIEGSTAYDSGAQLRDGAKVLATLGCCSEDEWPYEEARLTVAPPQKDYTAALQNMTLRYHRMRQILDHLKARLAEGHPFGIGFTVYSSLETAAVDASGDVPIPDLRRDKVLGAHAVAVCGSDDGEQRFIFRNSWGTSWGAKGYGTLPYVYLTDPNLSSDFWTNELVS